MPTAPINGVNIYYESHGSGFPLVLAYGLGGNTGMWAGQVAAFSQHHRFITWDPRGHGNTDSPTERNRYGMAISAEDLHGLLDYLDIDQAYVGGLSMGGGIATRFAIAHPERVAALLIIDSASASGVPMSAAMRAMREKTIELCDAQGMEAVADYALEANPNLRTQAEASAQAHQNLRGMYLALDRVGYANTVRALLKRDFPTERLSEIKVPTLILVGAEDPALEPARLMHNKIPGSQLVIIPGAGHLSNLDQPEAFNQHILTFLQDIES